MSILKTTIILLLSCVKYILHFLSINKVLTSNIANLKTDNLILSFDEYIKPELQDNYIVNTLDYRTKNERLIHSIVHALEETSKLKILPSSGSKTFKNVTILTKSGVAMISNFIYLDNFISNIDYKLGNDIKYTKRVFKRDSIVLEEAIVLSTYGIDGYYHWLFDVIPKLLHFLKHSERNHNYKIIINGKRLAFKEEAFDLLNLKSNLILISESKKDIFIKNCIIPDFVHPIGVPSITTIELIRNSFRNDSYKEVHSAKKIYVGRKSKRRNIINENLLINMLNDLGFVHNYLENMSFKDQINLFKSAEIIIGPHGAGLSNIVFSEHKFKLIELFPSSYNNACYFNIAMQLNADYLFLEFDTWDKFDNFKVDIDRIRNKLIEFLGF
jgi:hypothetical protein